MAALIKENAGGERRGIGPSTKAGFLNGSSVERFDPEGPKNPEREWRSNYQTKPLGGELDNGL